MYEGVCIARANKGVNSNFTVRKISFGEGVERVFPLYSPAIDSIEVVRRGAVRRAKLYYLRGRRGKSARIAERRDPRPAKASTKTEALTACKSAARRDEGASGSIRAPFLHSPKGVLLASRPPARRNRCHADPRRRHRPGARRPAAPPSSADARARVRQPRADRPGAARAQAVARRQAGDAAAQPPRRSRALRPVGDRSRDRRRADARRQQEVRHRRGA